MAHLKREQSPKQWPIERKGTTYLVRPSYNIDQGIPVLLVLRDVLKFAKTRREVRKALNAKQVLLNGKEVFDEGSSAVLFDVITIMSQDGKQEKDYKVTIGRNKKFHVEEISKEKAGHKIAKIINKKTLKGKKTQINLSDGRNFISDVKCKVNDSVLIDLKNKKLERVLPLKENTKVIVFAGKHAGENGMIKGIEDKNKIAQIDSDGKMVNILIKQLMVLE